MKHICLSGNQQSNNNTLYWPVSGRMFIILLHLSQRPALYADFTTKSSVSDYISTSKYTLQVANGIKQMVV